MVDQGFIQELERLGNDLQATEGKHMHGSYMLAAAVKLREMPSAPANTTNESKLDNDLTQALMERDNYHEWADLLAGAIATHLGVDIGVHTSANNAWAKALATLSQSSPQQPHTHETKWPSARDVGRYGDMSPHAHLRIGLDNDNDVYVQVWGEDGGASVEFCNAGSGGGASPKTRLALIATMLAMEEENSDRPDKDWWARRMGQSLKSKS